MGFWSFSYFFVYNCLGLICIYLFKVRNLVLSLKLIPVSKTFFILIQLYFNYQKIVIRFL